MKYLVSFIFLFTLNLNAVEVVLQDPQLNEPAPKFSALDSNGKTVSLDDFRGQPVILEWTNHECPYVVRHYKDCLLYTSPSPRDATLSRMPSSA